MEREFTLEEAADLLPALTERLMRLQRTQEALQALAGRAGEAGNGTGEHAAALGRARDEFAEALQAVQRLGVVVRDPGSGLVDFPARRDGEPVYLCWRLGEKRIGHWHSREEGFADRQPL